MSFCTNDPRQICVQKFVDSGWVEGKASSVDEACDTVFLGFWQMISITVEEIVIDQKRIDLGMF